MLLLFIFIRYIITYKFEKNSLVYVFCKMFICSCYSSASLYKKKNEKYYLIIHHYLNKFLRFYSLYKDETILVLKE